MRRRRLIGVYRGLLKSIEVPGLQSGSRSAAAKPEGRRKMESDAYPFTPKTYPID
jgi:hypothetical protein